MRVVAGPAEQVDAVALTGTRALLNELGGLHLHDLGVDVQSLLQLRLDVGGDVARCRQVAARHVPVEDLRGKTVGQPCIGEQRLRSGDIPVGPCTSLTAVLDGAGREVGRHLGTRRVEGVDDPLAVHRQPDRLANPHIVERREDVREAHVEDVRFRLVQQRQVRIASDRGVVLGTRERHAVRSPRLEFEQPSGTLRGPPQHCRLMWSHLAVVVVEAVEDDRIAAHPFLQLVRSGTDRVVDRGTARRLEMLGRLDAEHDECDLCEERRVRTAEIELDRELVQRRDLLHAPAVVAPAGVENHAFECGRCGSCRLRSRGIAGVVGGVVVA